MNIAYLANIRFPSERAHSAQIHNMCSEFAKLGHVVTLFASSRVVSECSSGYRLIRLFGGSHSPRSAFFFYLQEFFFFISFLRTTKGLSFDVIISRSEFLLYLLSFTRFNKSLLWESHDGRKNFFVQRLAAQQVRMVFTSEGQQANIFPGTTGVSTVAPNGIENAFLEKLPSKDEVCKSLGLNQDAFLVGYIGGFDSWKGVDTFFATSEQVPEGVHFAVIGGTEAELQQCPVLYPRVNFLGPRPYEELARNQQAFDVLVIPNTAKNDLSAKYTSPLKLFAHMASGVPIVASDIPSITTITGRELVTLFTPDDPVALARAIAEVRANYAEKLQKAAQLRTVASGYTWDARAKKILTFLGNKDRSV